MSDDEDYDDDDEEEEDFDEDEEGEEEEAEGADAEALKKEALAGDIATLLDVFGYIDRTTRRITSRLEVESKVGGKGGRKKGVGQYVTSSTTNAGAANTTSGGTKTAGYTKDNIRGGDDSFEGKDSDTGDELIGGWSQYETMNDADRGMLLEKAILALGLNQAEDSGDD